MHDGIFVRWSELLLDFRADFVLNVDAVQLSPWRNNSLAKQLGTRVESFYCVDNLFPLLLLFSSFWFNYPATNIIKITVAGCTN